MPRAAPNVRTRPPVPDTPLDAQRRIAALLTQTEGAKPPWRKAPKEIVPPGPAKGFPRLRLENLRASGSTTVGWGSGGYVASVDVSVSCKPIRGPVPRIGNLPGMLAAPGAGHGWSARLAGSSLPEEASVLDDDVARNFGLEEEDGLGHADGLVPDERTALLRPGAVGAGVAADSERAVRQEELKAAMGQWLESKGGVVNGFELASRFGSDFNTWVRTNAKKNDGKFRKWLATLPGMVVVPGAGNGWTVQLADSSAPDAAPRLDDSFARHSGLEEDGLWHADGLVLDDGVEFDDSAELVVNVAGPQLAQPRFPRRVIPPRVPMVAPPKPPKRGAAELAEDPAAKRQKLGSGIKGRTDEERAEAKAEYETWRDARLDAGTDPECFDCCSNNWFYAQTCLVCLAELDWVTYEQHISSSRHVSAYKKASGYSLKPDVPRPDPRLEQPLVEPCMERFLEVCRFDGSSVLSLGEQDYSFSLAIALRQMSSTGVVQLVASSYLAAHDPSEIEEHVKDDGLRAHYRRRSLPGMDGALAKHIEAIEDLGGTVLHSVDATDLPGTLMNQCDEGQFDVIVFPFPRASLRRGTDPRNSRLLKGFFWSVADSGLLADGGLVAVLLLRPQFPTWDTNCVAAEAGFVLVEHTPLPPGFYQSREMSGKTWSPKDAEVYVFQKGL